MSKRVSARLELPCCLLSPGHWVIWRSHDGCSNYEDICVAQGGGRSVSSPRGWERNGLDLSCSRVLILATREHWTSWRYQIAGALPAPCTGLTRHVEEIQITGITKSGYTHGSSSPASVSESGDRKSQMVGAEPPPCKTPLVYKQGQRQRVKHSYPQ